MKYWTVRTNQRGNIDEMCFPDEIQAKTQYSSAKQQLFGYYGAPPNSSDYWVKLEYIDDDTCDDDMRGRWYSWVQIESPALRHPA